MNFALGHQVRLDGALTADGVVSEAHVNSHRALNMLHLVLACGRHGSVGWHWEVLLWRMKPIPAYSHG